MSQPARRLVFVSGSPGRGVQRVGTARYLGQPISAIYGPVVCVTGSGGDSQCYLGVPPKVAAIQHALGKRILDRILDLRLIPPVFTIGVSDGQNNGTPEMHYSLAGRTATMESLLLHFGGSLVEGCISVVACDKPPPGTLAAILEHFQSQGSAIMVPDGSIHPGPVDSKSGQRCDIVTGFAAAGNPDPVYRNFVAREACPGFGSCGGVFTYNTMASFMALLGMVPIEMVSPAADDPRRLEVFPELLVDYLLKMMEMKLTPRDIVTPAAIRNGLTIALAIGGSTNVVLHAVEIARAAGIDLWKDVISQEEFNELSMRVPVVVNARPFGIYSMVDIDAVGGLQVIVAELLRAGLLDGSCITCTGETLAEQVVRLNPRSPDHRVIYSIDTPYQPTGSLRFLRGNLAPAGGAVIKIAGVEKGLVGGVFRGRARTFDSEMALILSLDANPDSFNDGDMVVIRYEGPRGAPGMPELLECTARIKALCVQRKITIALMTDARFSGGSVGVVIGHVGPEAFLGGPIALVQNGDTIIVDLNANTLHCLELGGQYASRLRAWMDLTAANGGVHPSVRPVNDRWRRRMRNANLPALEGGGIKVD